MDSYGFIGLQDYKITGLKGNLSIAKINDQRLEEDTDTVGRISVKYKRNNCWRKIDLIIFDRYLPINDL